jgi:DNA-binding NtrC family response regulator
LLPKIQRSLSYDREGTIFVVDDDPSMRLGIKRLLRKRGFKIELFDSAEDLHARAEIRRSNCLVLDINLKKQSGIDLRRELTSAGISIPVIFVTTDVAPTFYPAVMILTVGFTLMGGCGGGPRSGAVGGAH